MPGSTTDLAIPYALPADPRAEWPATNLSMSERIEALIRGAEAVVVDPLGGLAGLGTTVDQLRLRTPMAWGASLAAKPDLDSYGADSTVGQPVYVDSVGDIRTQPLVIPGGSGFTAATPPGSYPVGMSLLSVPTTTPKPDGWPIGGNGAVHTLRRWGDTADNTTSAWQWCLRATTVIGSIEVYFRAGANTTWSGWVVVAEKYNGLAVSTGLNPVPAAVTDLPGATLTVPCPGPDAVYSVNASFDVQNTVVVGSGDVFQGRLDVAGGAVAVGGQTAIYCASGAASGFRYGANQTWRVTGVSEGNVIFKLQASGADKYRVNGTHTVMSVVQVS